MNIEDSLSYDDILLIPSYSDVVPSDISVKTSLTSDILLNIPLLSTAMDTVTEEKLAISIALHGGAGVIHRNLSPKKQGEQVSNVKRYLNWVIDNPVTTEKSSTVASVRALMEKYNVSGLPVIDEKGRLCGIITGRDLRFCRDDSLRVQTIMTPDPIVERDAPTPGSAQEKFDIHKIEKLPVIDKSGKLTGLITVKDMEKHQQYPEAATDNNGRLIVGTAVSPEDFEERMPILIESRADFVVLDTAHGDSKNVIETVSAIKKTYRIPVIGGNVATKEGAQRLIDAGVDALKVGVDRKSTRLNSSHIPLSRMPSSA